MSTIKADEELKGAEEGVPVEVAPPAKGNAEPTLEKKTFGRRKTWIIVGVVVLILAIIGLSVGLSVSSKRQNSEASGAAEDDNEGEQTQPSATPPPSPTDPGFTAEPTGTTTITTVPPTTSPVSDSTSTPVTNPPTTFPSDSDAPENEATMYQSTSGIFNVTLPLFSSSTAGGYSDPKDLERDLIEAVKFKVNRIVEQPPYYAQRPVDTVGGDDVVEDSAAGDMGRPASPPAAGDVDDFETNTVEDSIDEGDLLKTNGVHAFAAYGNYVIIWEVASGKQVTNITLPSIQAVDNEKEPVDPYEAVDPEDLIDFGAGGGGTRRKLDAWYWNPEPMVRSLLLHQDRLVVVADGYGQLFRSLLDYEPALYDALATRIMIYDISPLSTSGATGDVELPLVHDTNINGNFNSIRADENKVHVVTFSGLNTWVYLEQQLAKTREEFTDLSDEDYLESARKLANDELIPAFVSRLIDDISTSGEPADVARISLWQKDLPSDPKVDSVAQVFDQGVINNYAQVTSFDMLHSATETLKVTEAGMFMPTGWGHTYATDEMLVVIGQGWNWVPEIGGSLQTTYLHGFALQDDGTAIPVASGSLDGSVLNEYSVDVVGNYLRVAVTIRNDRWVFPVADDGETADVDPPPLRTENYIVVMEMPAMTDLSDGGDVATMKEVGRSENLGKDGEVFTSVRFSKNVAYAVTFEQTDPFYVISFENDQTKPEVLGELNITGFASYLHFINDAEDLLLGVGQEADTEGRRLGLQVTLYDATTQTNPVVIDRYEFELDENVYSSSAAEFDYKAFRYVKLGEDFGILIIPVRIDSYSSTEGNFDGFALLDVSATRNITERFTIPHVDSADFRLGCYYWATLPQRSFVVDGDVTTLKGHSVRSYNLDSQERLFGIDLDVERETDHCIYW